MLSNANKDYDLDGIIDYWNTGQGDEPLGYREFLEECVNTCKESFNSYIGSEFGQNPDVVSDITDELNKQIESCGGVEEFLGCLNLEKASISSDVLRLKASRDAAASKIQRSYRNSKAPDTGSEGTVDKTRSMEISNDCQGSGDDNGPGPSKKRKLS